MRGDRVRHQREAQGMTQAQLAQITGLRQFHISRIESGSIEDVKGQTLAKLAQALHVTTDYLLGLVEDVDAETLTAAVA